MRPALLLPALVAAVTAAATSGALWACSGSGGNAGGGGSPDGGGTTSLSGCLTQDDGGTCSAEGCFCHRGFVSTDAGSNFTRGTPPAEGGINVDCLQSSCNVTCGSTRSPAR